MKYQLVLQFPANSMEDFDRLVSLQDTLIEELNEVATVDGHDFGLGKLNIFVLTDDPATVFGKPTESLSTKASPTSCSRHTAKWTARTT